MTISKSILLLIAALGISSCDYYRTRQCEWQLEPNKDHKDLVEPGWVPLCVKNYKLGRQKCFLSAPLKWAESVNGKSFRLVDIEIDETVMPRKILDAKPCEP